MKGGFGCLLFCAGLALAWAGLQVMGGGELPKKTAAARLTGKTAGRVLGDVRKVRYRWKDPNALKILGVEDDKLVVDGDIQARKFEAEFAIAEGRLEEVVEGFGMPDEAMAIEYRTLEEYRTKKQALDRMLKARGFVPEGEDSYRVDYAGIVQEGRDDFAGYAGQMSALAEEAGYRTRREWVGLMASLPQALKYRVPPEKRRLGDGRKVCTGGVMPPLETLSEGWGDCDTKALLFAAFASHLDGVSIVFLSQGEHLIVGVQEPPRLHDAYVRIRGLPYVLIEITDGWPVGRVARDFWRGNGRERYEVYPVWP